MTEQIKRMPQRMPTFETYVTGSMAELPEPFADLSALAERLGVAKHTEGPATVLLTMKNGDRYSLFALVNAFLDRMDNARP